MPSDKHNSIMVIFMSLISSLFMLLCPEFANRISSKACIMHSQFVGDDLMYVRYCFSVHESSASRRASYAILKVQWDPKCLK